MSTAAKPTTLRERILADPRVESIDDERGTGDGWWVYFKKGWINAPHECHCIHEDTLTKCRAALSGVVRCDSPGSPCQDNCCS